MRRALGLLLASRLIAACNEPTEAQRLGVYAVQATRTSDTCGSQLAGKVPSARFNVALSLRQGVIQWGLEGADTTAGTFDVYQGTFRVAADSSSLRIAPDRRRDIVGCVLRRADVIEGVVSAAAGDAGPGLDAGGAANGDAGTVFSAFHATESIAYGTESGDCSALVGVGEGQALALPCLVTYRLDAERVAP